MQKFSALMVMVLAVVGVFLGCSLAQAEDVKPEIMAALDEGDTTLAISLIQRDIDVDRSYHLNYYLLGRIDFQREQYENALEQFEMALDKKSKHYESMYYLGLTQLKLGQVDEALKTMEKGIKKAKKEKSWFENGYGMVMLAKEDNNEAVKHFMKALVDEPDNAEYHINLGDAYFFQGVPSLAASEYETAQQLDTAGTEVYFHWAEACLEMRDYNCAIEKLGVVLSKDSTYAPARRRAGQIYFKAALSARSRDQRKARFIDAIGSYRRYLELTNTSPDSSSVRVFFELGMAYANLNAFDSSGVYLKWVIDIPYEPKDVYFYYGKSLWGTRDYENASVYLLKHLDWVSSQEEYHSSINDAELYQLLGDSYYYRKPNDFYNAVKYYKLSIEANSNQKRILQNMAVAYHSLRSYVQAIEYYDKRIELGMDSTSAGIYKNAAYCALNLAGEEGEEDDLEMLDEEDDGAPVAVETGDPNVNYFEIAVDYMEEYLAYYPNDDKVILRVASTYLTDLGDCTNGIKYFERLLTIDPNNCDAKRMLGYAYFGDLCGNLKNYSKALGYLKDAYDCIAASEAGGCSDVNVILWVAQCYHLRAVDRTDEAAKADFKNAHDWYNKCLKCEPNRKECKEGRDQTSFEF